MSPFFFLVLRHFCCCYFETKFVTYPPRAKLDRFTKVQFWQLSLLCIIVSLYKDSELSLFLSSQTRGLRNKIFQNGVFWGWFIFEFPVCFSPSVHLGSTMHARGNEAGEEDDTLSEEGGKLCNPIRLLSFFFSAAVDSMCWDPRMSRNRKVQEALFFRIYKQHLFKSWRSHTYVPSIWNTSLMCA